MSSFVLEVPLAVTCVSAYFIPYHVTGSCEWPIGFASTTPHDWPKNSRHEEKLKQIVTRSQTFSRALLQSRVITSSFDWFTELSLRPL